MLKKESKELGKNVIQEKTTARSEYLDSEINSPDAWATKAVKTWL